MILFFAGGRGVAGGGKGERPRTEEGEGTKNQMYTTRSRCALLFELVTETVARRGGWERRGGGGLDLKIPRDRHTQRST